VRTKAPWLLVIPFRASARPTAALLLAGGAVTAVGLLLRAWSAGTIDKGESLATSGPYAFTRNPLYLGSFLIGMGLSMAGGHFAWPVAFVAFFGAVYFRTMNRESKELLALFGAWYAEYAAHVPTFLPRLAPYRSESTRGDGFRWSRYRRYREWEALLGAAAAFAVLAISLRSHG
jgi:protein-S-isoprenylcysteine O-methyltransferase Ste14